MNRKVVLLVGLALLATGGLLLYRAKQRREPVQPRTAEPSPAQTDLRQPEADAQSDPLAIALDRDALLGDRIDAIEKLPEDLPRDARASLIELVKTRGEHNTIRNNVLDHLEECTYRPSGMGAALLAMFRDPSADPVWRDYCLQHLEQVYDFASNQEEIVSELYKVAREDTGGTMNYPGTALLSLNRLTERHPELQKQIDFLSQHIIAEEEMDEEKGVVVFQVARRKRDASRLAQARSVIRDEEALSRLRMSAMAYLAQVGTADDRALLEACTDAKERRIARAARLNLKTFDERVRAD
jgi:hypothetical protein